MAIAQLSKNIEIAKQRIVDAPIATPLLKNNLIQLLEKRWNGTFALIGQTLLKKQSHGGKHSI
ncbi:MAG: hypothetical protein K2Q14_08205 [Gammaproteobacteria bacterium]|nr:hypothetical protein [Gammaproteobacteria bacterium]